VGLLIDSTSLLIASTAISRGDAIVTGNMRHFDDVPGLVVHTLD
jgi:predicted nucleic acid-binding protein